MIEGLDPLSGGMDGSGSPQSGLTGPGTALIRETDERTQEAVIGDGCTLVGVCRLKIEGRPVDSIFFRRSTKVYESGQKLEQSDAENGTGPRLILRFLNVASVDVVIDALKEIRSNLEASSASPAERSEAGTNPQGNLPVPPPPAPKGAA